jgi:hypothetical protein
MSATIVDTLGCRLPLPRRPGLHASLECMETEDAIVRLLCGTDMVVTSEQVAAAVVLARNCASDWDVAAQRWAAVSRRMWVYPLNTEDFEWLDSVVSYTAVAVDPATMTALEALTDAVPLDTAATAALNAARWIVKQYERTGAAWH